MNDLDLLTARPGRATGLDRTITRRLAVLPILISLTAAIGEGRVLAEPPRPFEPYAAGRQGNLEPPSFECPAAKGSLPEGAATAIAGFLGGDATPICLGDLNGNGRPEVLAVVAVRTFGKGLGYYWVTRKSGIFEAGPDKRRPWTPVLLTSDRIENARGVVGWQDPVEKDAGIGLRFTMTADKGRICVQLRRLDTHRRSADDPLLLATWDPAVERYEIGRCAGGTAGTFHEASRK